VRLRLYRSGKIRPYRGERFVAPAEATGEPNEILEYPSPPEGNVPRLSAHGSDVTPDREPAPSLTIDRIVTFEVGRSERKLGRVRLAGDCAGVQADLAGRRTCVDHDWTSPPDLPLSDDLTLPTRGQDTAVGTWPILSGPRIPAACDESAEALRARESGTVEAPAFDEERCIPGGAFVFGDSSWGRGELADSPDSAGIGDERIAAVPRFLLDRYEYSVARAKRSAAAAAVSH
jgi:hypothetical protein